MRLNIGLTYELLLQPSSTLVKSATTQKPMTPEQAAQRKRGIEKFFELDKLLHGITK
jgi:hypothetical protein